MVQTSNAILVAVVALSVAPSAFAAPVNTDSLVARSIWGTVLTDAEKLAKPLLKDAGGFLKQAGKDAATEAAKEAGKQAGGLAVSKVAQAASGPTPVAQKAVAKKVKRDSVDSRSIWGTVLTDAERLAKPLLKDAGGFLKQAGKDAASEAAKEAGKQAGGLAVSKVAQAASGPTPAAQKAAVKKVKRDDVDSRSIWGTLLTDAEKLAKPLLKDAGGFLKQAGKDAASEAAKEAGKQAGGLAVSKVAQAASGPTPVAQKAVAKKVKRDSVDSRSIWGTVLSDAEKLAKPLLKDAGGFLKQAGKDAATEAAKEAGKQAGGLAVSKVAQAASGPTPVAQKAVAKKVKRDLFNEVELLERYFDEYLASRSYGDFDELD